MAYNFLRGDRDQPFLLPPDLRDWLPADHLAWFILDVVDQLDLGPFLVAYRADGHGHPADDPRPCWVCCCTATRPLQPAVDQLGDLHALGVLAAAGSNLGEQLGLDLLTSLRAARPVPWTWRLTTSSCQSAGPARRRP